MPLPFLVTAIINIGISIGLSYISKKLQAKEAEMARKKAERDRAANSGSVLDIQYGEGQPRMVAIGTVVTAGQAVYDNTFGTGNKTLQRVLKLSDFRCSALSRVAIDNAWVSLGSLDATKGYPVTSGDYSGLIWVKFLDGSQTTADTYLTGNDNPDGRWSANHKGIGCAYVIVTLEYDDEKLSSIPEMLFEVDGAPLYDPRKDTSVGGSGSHRWNDVTTWEFSENPILAEYNYRMGFYTGTYGSGHDVFCGMGMAQSELDYTRYETAADICDEVVEGEARYRVSTFLEADNEHGNNIEDLMLACAGMVVESVTGPYPILGASQTPVATLTNDDLVADAPVEFRKHRPVSEVVNTVSGVYSEPNFVYAETGYAAQSIAAAVTADRRTIDYPLNLPMVPSKRQAEQLASIYLSENRYEATKTVTVGPKWQVLEVGDWITWTDDEDGAASRDYQIVSLGIASLGSDQPRVVQLTLQERDDSIYDGIGPVSPPTAATRPGAPVYLQELQSFSATAVYVTGSGGRQVPAIYVSWDAVTDPTVDSILIEWRPDGDDTRRVGKVVNRTATVAVLQEGVVGSSDYEVRNTIIPRPARVTSPSAYIDVTTGAPDSVGVGDLDAAALATLEQYRDDLTRIFSTQNSTALGTVGAIIGKAQEVLGRRGLKASVDGAYARIATEQTVRADNELVVANQIIALDGRVQDAEGNITDILNLEVSPDSVLLTRLDLMTGAIDDIDNPVTGSIKQEATLRLNGDQANADLITLLTTRVGNIDNPTTGTVALEAKARADRDKALSDLLIAVTATANRATAQGLVKLEATSAPAGVTARFGTYLRTSTNVNFPPATTANAAEFLEIVNGVSRKVIVANRTEFYANNGVKYAMFDSTGAYFNNARITNLTATNINVGTIKVKNLDLTEGGYAYTRIVNSIGDDNINANLKNAATNLHDWFVVFVRVNITDPASSGSGTASTWEWRLSTAGGGYNVLDSFSSVNGTTRDYNFTFFVNPTAQPLNGFGNISLARTSSSNAGGTRNNAFWLIMSGEQQV
jgi:hypothetical protein